MALTINRILLKRRKKDDGTIPIYIRFTENRKSRYRSTGFAVKEKEWDDNDQLVKKHRRSKHINIQLRRMTREIEELKDEMDIAGTLSMDALLRGLENEKDPRSILHQAKAYREYLKSEERYWERRHFKVVIGNLESFITDSDSSDQLEHLDADWIEDFQDYLLNEVGNGNNTVRKKLQRFKGMTSWLIKDKELENDPFTAVEKVELKRSNGKVKLTFEQIKAIENLHVEKDSDLWHTRNYFMYSFYNAGIRFGDLCCLTWSNLIDGRLVYEMNKTGQQKSINQLEPMYRLLLSYIKSYGRYLTFNNWEPDSLYYVRKSDNPMTVLQPIVTKYAMEHHKDYIFPILNNHYSDPMELRAKISSKNVLVNRDLKVIAKKTGIQANISFHVSRHSFAHYALKKGMDLYAISKALGHSDLKVTEEYIKTFDEELLDKSMSNLFN